MKLRPWAAVPVFVCMLQSNAVAQSVSLSLEEALARAREASPALLIARARIEEARARLDGARVRFRDNPAVDVGSGPRRTEAGTMTDLDVGIMQLFETGGQRAARIAGAEAGIARESAAADDARRVALRAVALAHTRSVYAQARIDSLARAEAVAEEVVAVADRRYAAGDIAVLDLNIASIALARARAVRLAAEGERAIASGELQRLLGLPSARVVVAVGPLHLQRRPDLAALLAAAANRPDLRAIDADLQGAAADVRLGRAATRPDIELGARMKREEGHRAILGELTIALPLFNQGQELRAAGAARALRSQVERQTLLASVESEVRSLFAVFTAREAALNTFEREAMPGIDENEALARRSFEVGQISLPELLLIRRELVETQLEYLNHQWQAAEAAIEQEAAAGVTPLTSIENTILIVILTLGAAGCSREEAARPPDVRGAAASSTAEKTAENIVQVSEEMLRDLRMTTSIVEQHRGGEASSLLGELGVNLNTYAEVSAPLPARVVALRAVEGQVVRTSDPLATLESGDLARARGDLATAQARRNLAQRSLDRKRGLSIERIVPLREVEESEHETIAAESAVRAAGAALQALGASDEALDGSSAATLVLRSPVAGVILERTVALGQTADPSRPLFRIGDLSTLWLTVHAFEGDAVRLSRGASARITFAALPGRTFEGKVALIGQSVDVDSRTVAVRIDLANRERQLRPGMSATAWLPVGDQGTLLAVPAAAVQRVRDRWCVFIPKDHRTFEIRFVGRGRDLAGEVELLSGVRAGEPIVVEGAFLLKAETERTSAEGEHRDQPHD